MGYWTGQDLPFTYDLATKFPIGDRWFCSVLGQTDPNRRYLIAATSVGMTDDIGESPGNFVPDASLPAPANGTIFDRLTAAGISWTDYNSSFPAGATMELFPTDDTAFAETNAKPIAQFFTDAQAGTLPSFSLLDPNYDTQSQENPQNIVVGEAFVSQVVQALGSSPLWGSTLLILTYDEHGGYYDHVPPPAALAPDAIPPMVPAGRVDLRRLPPLRIPGARRARRPVRQARLREPCGVRPHLDPRLPRAQVEPAGAYLPRRQRQRSHRLPRPERAGRRTAHVPRAAQRWRPPGDTPAALACLSTGPGTIPPASAAPLPAPAIRLEIKRVRVNRRLRGLVVELETESRVPLGACRRAPARKASSGKRPARTRVNAAGPSSFLFSSSLFAARRFGAARC